MIKIRAIVTLEGNENMLEELKNDKLLFGYQFRSDTDDEYVLIKLEEILPMKRKKREVNKNE